jgi:vacuolar-type H+-ATPase subunit H
VNRSKSNSRDMISSRSTKTRTKAKHVNKQAFKDENKYTLKALQEQKQAAVLLDELEQAMADFADSKTQDTPGLPTP